jgi:hypothetical protein
MTTAGQVVVVGVSRLVAVPTLAVVPIPAVAPIPVAVPTLAVVPIPAAQAVHSAGRPNQALVLCLRPMQRHNWGRI